MLNGPICKNITTCIIVIFVLLVAGTLILSGHEIPGTIIGGPTLVKLIYSVQGRSKTGGLVLDNKVFRVRQED